MRIIFYKILIENQHKFLFLFQIIPIPLLKEQARERIFPSRSGEILINGIDRTSTEPKSLCFLNKKYSKILAKTSMFKIYLH